MLVRDLSPLAGQQTLTLSDVPSSPEPDVPSLAIQLESHTRCAFPLRSLLLGRRTEVGSNGVRGTRTGALSRHARTRGDAIVVVVVVVVVVGRVVRSVGAHGWWQEKRGIGREAGRSSRDYLGIPKH